MARVAAGAALSANTGPGTGRAGTAQVAPRPSSSTEGALYDAEVKRAKAIALGLFLALVLIHSRKGE